MQLQAGMISTIGHITSLALSVPAIWIGLLVSSIAFVTLQQTWRFKGELTREQTFVLGVMISFIGGSLDSAYWLIPWSLDFVGSEYAEAWFFAGYIPNIFFRNLCDIISGICHLVALVLAFGPKLKRFVFWSTVASGFAGLAYVALLILWVQQ